MGPPPVARIMMAVGALLFVIGALLAQGVKLPLGRLPGDIVIRRESGSFYFPLASCALLSALLSLLSWLLRR